MIARCAFFFPLLAPFLLHSPQLRADEIAGAQTDSLTIGVGAQNAPRYSGSSSRTWSAVPVVQGRKGAFFVDTQKGIGYDLGGPYGLYFEQSLGYNLGRDEENSSWRPGSDKLRGMGSIKAVANTGLAIGWQATPRLSIEGRAILPLTDSQGVQYQTSITDMLVQNDRDALALQGMVLFGDARYNATFYGVNAGQSQRSGYRQFRPGSGLYGTNISLTWNHQFTQHWGTSISGSYTRLANKVSDSPIVEKRNQLDIMLAAGYSF